MPDPCVPTIDGTWKNFVTEYGADPTGVLNSSGAVDSWLAYGAGLGATEAKLYIPPGTYKLSGTNALTNGIQNATISAWGATVDVMFLGGTSSWSNDLQHSVRVATLAVGATSATILAADGTLIGPADASLFTVGRWVMITGLALQVHSTPPNHQWFEMRQITGIVGNVLSWSEPLRNAYKSTWPHIDASETTINIGTSTLTTTVRTLVSGEHVLFSTSGALPTGLTIGQDYYVKNISGSTFQLSNLSNLSDTVALSGTQSGTHYFHGNQNVDLGGPATIYALGAKWDGTHNYYGLTCTYSGAVNCGGARNIVLCGMAFTGQGPAPSISEAFTISRTQIGNQNEVDKWVKTLTYDNCTGTALAQIFCQSPGIEELRITGGTVLRTLNGTGYNTTIEDSTFTDEVIVGATFFGRSNNLTVNNSLFPSARVANSTYVDPSTLTFSVGTFRIARAVADTGAGSYSNVYQWAVPGFAYYMARDTSYTNDAAGITSFRITDIRYDATYIYLDTDIVGALPTPTYGGQTANRYYCYGVMLATEQPGSGPADVTQPVIAYATQSWVPATTTAPRRGGWGAGLRGSRGQPTLLSRRDRKLSDLEPKREPLFNLDEVLAAPPAQKLEDPAAIAARNAALRSVVQMDNAEAESQDYEEAMLLRRAIKLLLQGRNG